MIKQTTLWLLIGLGVLASEVEAKRSTQALFSEFELESPVTLTHPVMVLNVMQSPSQELVTLGVDDDGQRWLHVYSFNQQSSRYSNTQALAIPDKISRFDISDKQSAGFQSLYFLDAKSVFEYDVSQNRLIKLFDTNTVFLSPTPDHISRGNFVIDLNEDGQDELLLPTFTTLNYFYRNQQGGWQAQALPIKAHSIIDDNKVQFKLPTYHIVDTNGDGKKDIVIAKQGMLQSFHQLPQGAVLTTAVAIKLADDIAGLEWWYKRDATGSGLNQANLVYRHLTQLRDINNDSITDMVVKSTKSSGVLDRENSYQIFIGTMDNGQLSFLDQPTSEIRAEGTLSGFELVDIDNDKKLEVALSGFDIGLSQIVGALLSGSIDQDVYIFVMNEDGVFGEEPSVSKEVELSFSLSSGQTGNPLVKLADVNGDNLKDLVLSTGTDKLKVYLATTGKRRFERRALKYKTQLPQDASVVEIADLNGDGKDDMVLKYGRLDDAAMRKKIKVLMAK